MLNKLLNLLLVNKNLIFKYILISVFSYTFIFFSLYFFIDKLLLNKSLSFFIVYGINYLFLYIIQLKFLFTAEHTNSKLIKYITSIAVFYLLANILFNLGLIFSLHYYSSTILTIVILFPFRFFVSKNIIYK